MQRQTSLPPDFSELEGKITGLHQTSATELASSCPRCGTTGHRGKELPDRFRLFLTGGPPRAWCRRCGYMWFPHMRDPNWRPDPGMMKRWQDERAAQTAEVKAKAERTLALIEKERRWMSYHDNLDEAARSWWISQGIEPEWQDWWKLGYVAERGFEHNDEVFTRPAFTIPKFDLGWHFTNIDYRIVNPPENVGKYRPIAGLPAAFFLSRPDMKQFSDEVFIVEGSKKAMVLGLRKGLLHNTVIGIPGKSAWAGVEERVKPCGRVWIILDPDAIEWAHKLGRAIGSAARIVELPTKIDDAILHYGLSWPRFQGALRQAVKPNVD